MMHRRENRYSNNKRFSRTIFNNNNYDGHDDRGSNNNNSNNNNNNNNRGPGRDNKYNSRRKTYTNLGRKRLDLYKIDKRDRTEGSLDDAETWFKILVPRGAKCSKEHLMSQLQQNSGLVFMPFNFHAESNSAVFFIQGGDQMAAIRACSRRIYDTDGYALPISVQPSPIPILPVNKKVEETVAVAIKNRYDYKNQALLLNAFSQIHSFIEAGLYIPLSRPIIFNLIVEKIKKEYSEIVGLSVADNKLTTLSPLSHLPSDCKNLKALDISNNKIKSVSELDHIKGFELVELAINGNPFANAAAFSEADKSVLVSSLRKRFPKLTKLDGADLPPAIGFDVGDNTDIPPSYGHHIPNEIKNFVAEFLEQYFKIYDSDDRRPMLAAYHDQAVFSYSIGRTDNKVNTFTQSMISGSRNLLRIREDGEAKTKLLHVGGQAIVDALSAMPRTKHAPSMMKIDVPFYYQPNFFVVVVNGVFKEFTKKQVHIRAFGRTFLIVPQGQGFVIINDMLVITNATVEQVQKFSRTLDTDTIINCIKEDRFGTNCLDGLSLGDISTDLGFSLEPSQPIGSQPAMLDEATKEAMVQQFCSMTNMNRQFAAQCLAENTFDLQKSFEVFTTLHKQGAIPEAAFQQ